MGCRFLGIYLQMVSNDQTLSMVTYLSKFSECGSGAGAHCGAYVGSATSGWLWPGRSMFRIGSKQIAPKFQRAAGIAPSNRLDLFYGTVNYHWRIDNGKTKGFIASQLNDFAGFKGNNRVYINNASEYDWGPGTQVWIGTILSV